MQNLVMVNIFQNLKMIFEKHFSEYKINFRKTFS